MSGQQAVRKKKGLTLVELCASPGTLLGAVQATVLENNGRILKRDDTHPYSAAISFEVFHKQVIEIYALLLESGMHLSAEAHEQFALFLQRARYGEHAALIEMNLTLYSNCCGEEIDVSYREQFRSLDGKEDLCFL